MDKDSPAARRRVLAGELRKLGAGFALISHPKHIFYFTGFPTNLNMWHSIMKGPISTSFLAVDSEGRGALLVGLTELMNPFTKERYGSIEGLELGVTEYEDYSLSGDMVTYGEALALHLRKWLKRLGLKSDTVAIEQWNLAQAYRGVLEDLHDGPKLAGISEFLLAMRNSKGADEVSDLARAVKILDYSYGAAKKASVAGNTELDVYASANTAAFAKYGPFAWVVGDYASGERSLGIGGAPTGRVLKRGDTIVLDLQAASNNYWADLCRTFVVGRRPGKSQERALSVLKEAKKAAESLLVPGTEGREVYKAVSLALTGAGYSKLPHHAGHCIGLDDQEPPWFVPAERRRLEEGSVCVVEPGLYRKDSGGIRIEDQYVVTKKGPRKLSGFPLGLA